MAKQPTEILKGTLDLLILKTLALEPRHGVAVADRILQITRGTFNVKAGSLFPALHRLEQEGFIAGEWGTTGRGTTREVVPPDRGGTKAAGAREEELGAYRARDRTGAGSGVKTLQTADCRLPIELSIVDCRLTIVSDGPMRVLKRSASLWRSLFAAAHLDRELDDELQCAVDELTARHVARGMREADARRAARVELGGVEQVKEQVRAARIGNGVDTTQRDVRYAWRFLWKAPGFAAIIILTLGLGIGATTAIFTVVNALLLEPLPYRDADRLVFVWQDLTDAGYPRAPLASPELLDLRGRAMLFEGFGGIWANTAALTGDGDPEQLRIGLVTANFFTVLGAEAALGRTFRSDDESQSASPGVILSWSLFSRRFGADPSVVGRRIQLNRRPTTVIGVMPERFRLLMPPDASVPDDQQAWQLLNVSPRSPRSQQFIRVVARMKPGVSLPAAQQEIARIAGQVGREFKEVRAIRGDLLRGAAPGRRRSRSASGPAGALRRGRNPVADRVRERRQPARHACRFARA